MTNAKNDEEIISALGNLRSVRGLETAINKGFTVNQSIVETALKESTNPIAQSFLIPFAPHLEADLPTNDILPSPFRKHLKLAEPSSSRHLALVEAVRLRYKRAMQDLDRLDKDEHRKKQQK